MNTFWSFGIEKIKPWELRHGQTWIEEMQPPEQIPLKHALTVWPPCVLETFAVKDDAPVAQMPCPPGPTWPKSQVTPS